MEAAAKTNVVERILRVLLCVRLGLDGLLEESTSGYIMLLKLVKIDKEFAKNECLAMKLEREEEGKGKGKRGDGIFKTNDGLGWGRIGLVWKIIGLRRHTQPLERVC